MKFNWGTGIVASIVIFVLLNLVFVLFIMNQRYDLVTNDYYEQEIKYQQVIDKQNNLFALSKEIEFKVNKNEVTVIFPEDLRGRELNGNLVFYRAVNADLDFKIPINLNDSLSQTVNFSGREPGYWKVTVDFSDGKLEYLQEKKLIIGI